MRSKAYSEIGIIIKEARLKKEITQKDLSDILGFTCTQYISNLERGVTTMSADKLGKICAILQIPDKKIQRLLVDEYIEKLEIGFKEGKEELSQEQFKKTA
ncbi:MAG: helix-turn-helix transcriptional regulator [Bdellovibrionales bacterium]|nr:helix-turn-helix transcriptional regulator [Bdellovibrionales bacterium]